MGHGRKLPLGKTTHYRFIYSAFYLKKKLACSCLCYNNCGIIGFCYSTFFVTTMYRSSVKMLVDVKSGNSSYVTNEQVVVSMRLVETIRDIIVTDQILDPVIDELDLSESAGSLASKISVEETQIININITYNDHKIALGIVKEIMKTTPEQINQWFESGSGSIKVASNPTSSSSPIFPNIPRNTIIFALAGFVAVLAVVSAKYLLNIKFNSADDITNVLGLNVLGVIPLLESLENTEREGHTVNEKSDENSSS